METIKSTIASLTGDSKHDDTTQNHQTPSSHHENSGTTSATSDHPAPAEDQASRTVEGGAHQGHTDSSGNGSSGLPNELEKTLSGPRDPAVQGEEHPKMTGEGAPGSHSALFGLTPDGKKA
jgi:hypothetical protein